MATLKEIASAIADDRESRAIEHGLTTYRGDAAWAAVQVSVALEVYTEQPSDELLGVLDNYVKEFDELSDLLVELTTGRM